MRCWGSTHPRKASEHLFYLKSTKRCLLSLTDGNGNPNKTEIFLTAPVVLQPNTIWPLLLLSAKAEHGAWTSTSTRQWQDIPLSHHQDGLEEAKLGSGVSSLPRGDEKQFLAQPHGHLGSLDLHLLPSSKKNPFPSHCWSGVKIPLIGEPEFHPHPAVRRCHSSSLP